MTHALATALGVFAPNFYGHRRQSQVINANNAGNICGFFSF